MNYYYLDSDAQTAGPVSMEELHHLLDTHGVTPETLVAPEGGEDWHPLSTFLSPAAVPPPPPAPPRAPHSSLPPASAATPRRSRASSLVAIIGILLVLAGAGIGGLLWQSARSKSSAANATGSNANAKGHPGSNAIGNLPGNSHPLAEWYVLGRHLGSEAAIAYADFGLPFQADRGQIAHLLKSMEVDVKQIAPDAIAMCWEGYQDETSQKATAWSVPATQKRSILPKPVQGFVKFAQPQAEPEKDQTVLEHALAATVLIKTDSRKGEGHGSGFFVAPGIIVTNKHVIEGATSIQVRVNEETILPAQLVAASANNDIAIVRVRTKDHPLLALADSDSVKVGDDVSAIGYPLLDHLSATTSFGRISSSDRTFAGNPCFQIDLSINHGNSGGPLVDHTGRAIGINTFGLGDFNVDRFNFAIKMNAVLPFIKKHLAEAE